jgi:hypothetical protein
MAAVKPVAEKTIGRVRFVGSRGIVIVGERSKGEIKKNQAAKTKAIKAQKASFTPKRKGKKKPGLLTAVASVLLLTVLSYFVAQKG